MSVNGNVTAGEQKVVENIKRSIDDLMKQKVAFVVPSYQRGYRWTKKQVEMLLKDIDEFCTNEYILQPLVVQQNDNDKEKWIVVDGQQRLTTIYMILSHLDKKSPKYSLEYETRNGNENNSTNFLANIASSTGVDNACIDFFYMSEAYQIICHYFESKGDDYKNNFLGKLTQRVKFLWYELGSTRNALEEFEKLNTWKIGAKDSELVKCVLLTPIMNDGMSDEGKKETRAKARIRAAEWDAIERDLNDDQFFAFITPRNTPHEDDRMTVLFRYAGYNVGKDKDKEEAFPFLAKIQEAVKNEGSINEASLEQVWGNVVSAYYQLKSWFHNPVMYHAFGWYVHRKPEKESEKVFGEEGFDLKLAFAKLKDCDFEFKPDEKGNDHNGGSNDKLHRWLLLHNVAYCWKHSPKRYDFIQHRRINSWTLEHIFARNQRDLKDEKEFLEWFPESAQVNNRNQNINFDNYQTACGNGEGNKWIATAFKALNKVELYPDECEDNSWANLALLPGDSNSSLNNKLFAGKRDEIVEWRKSGWPKYWAPPVTEAIFMKSLPDLSQEDPFWSEKDKEAYVKNMQDDVAAFIGAFKKELKNV